MNIGVVVKNLDQHGGAEIFVLECLRHWQYKADITVYSTSCNPDLLAEFGVEMNRIEHVKLTTFEGKKDRFDLVGDLLVMPRLWEQELRPHDVYFLNGFPLHFISRHPSVYMCHEPLRILYDLRYQHDDPYGTASVHIYPEQQYRLASLRELEVQLQLIESADRRCNFDYLVANSIAMARYASNVYDRQVDLVAYPGVNLLSEVSEPSPDKRALYVGRLWSHKRVDLLIRALAQLREGTLDIVGQGPEKAKLKKLAESLGVKDRVIFHGGISEEELAICYRNATCGAYVPVREPFGLMPLEAAAAGRPVIVSPEGGYSEILDGDAVLTVAPNPTAIAKAMNRLFGNAELAKKMGACARAQVSNTTWQRTAGDLYQLFERAIGKSVELSAPSDRPIIGAHYYPWYDAGNPTRHWNENTEFAGVVDLPTAGLYTSASEETIKRHLDLAKRAGIDFFTINWEVTHAGVNPRDLDATARLFEEAERRGGETALSLMVSIQTTRLTPIKQALELAKEYSKSPVWQRLRGRPALWFFVSRDFFGSFYAHKPQLQSLCEAFAVLAAGGISLPRYLPADIRAFVDGWCLFNPFRVGKPEDWEELWDLTYQNHTSFTVDPYRVFCVSPGYDDRHLSTGERDRTEPRLVERDGGAVYHQMFECARKLDPVPEVIMITSFNEFHENTQIEPTIVYGDEYLQQTRKFVSSLGSDK